MCGMKALKDGERKFWMNQNLTELFVCRKTETTMRSAMRCECGVSVKPDCEGDATGDHLVQQSRGDGEDVDFGFLPGRDELLAGLGREEGNPGDRSRSAEK